MTIYRKFRLVTLGIAATLGFMIFGMFEIAKTGMFQFLEREHIEFTLLLDDRLKEYEAKNFDAAVLDRSGTRDTMGIRPLLEGVIKQPRDCLDSVNWLEVQIFRVLGFGQAFVLCEKDIKDSLQALELVDAVASKRISGAEFDASFTKVIAEIKANSHGFATIIPEARVFVRSLMIYSSILFGLICLSAIFLISRNVVGSIREMERQLKQVADTNDLTVTCPLKESDNEIGAAGAAFERLLATVKQAIQKIRESAEAVSEEARKMAASSQQIAESSNIQSDAAASMAAGVEQMTVSIDSISENSTHAQSASMENERRADASNSLVQNAVAQIEAVARSVSESAKIIDELGTQSEQISGIVTVIREVAEQTNLLALNAAIEAARAGEQGRGFAVVADEVRKLAERTAASTSQISDMINAIQDGTRRAVVCMQDGVAKVEESVTLSRKAGESIQGIKEGTRETETRVTEISSNLREQTVVANELAKSVERIVQMIDGNNAAVAANAGAATHLETLSQRLRSSVQIFKLEA